MIEWHSVSHPPEASEGWQCAIPNQGGYFYVDGYVGYATVERYGGVYQGERQVETSTVEEAKRWCEAMIMTGAV